MAALAVTDPVPVQFRAAITELYGPRIERVVLYGSRARGDARPDSDYDIAVFLKHLSNSWQEGRPLGRYPGHHGRNGRDRERNAASGWQLARRHVHIVANLVHPVTGHVARLGLTMKRMSDFCAADEQVLGDVRCHNRFIPKAVNENRSRVARRKLARAGQADKQMASNLPAPRP